MNTKIAAHTLIALFITLIMFFSNYSTAFAGDMVLGVIPDGIYPVNQTDISLVSEEITVTLTGGELGTVDCQFDFKNNGDAKTVVMAVPARINEKVTGWTREEFLNFNNFNVFHEKIEGPVPIKLVDSIPNQPMKENSTQPKYSKWYTFSIDFNKDEELSIYVIYTVNFPYDNRSNLFTGFLLESGSLWEGAIQHAKVIFDFWAYPMYSVIEASPHNLYRIEDNKLIWEKANFEPAYNLYVTQNNFTYSENRLYVLSKNPAENKNEIDRIKERIVLFNTSFPVINENRGKYIEEYNDALNSGDLVKAIFLKSALGLPSETESPEVTAPTEDNRGDNLTPENRQIITKEYNTLSLVMISSSLALLIYLIG